MTDDSKRSKVEWLWFVGGFIVFCLLGFWLTPAILYAEKEQPFQFSHAVHMENAGDCETCHSFTEYGRFTGTPKLASCLECHDPEEPLGDTPEEKIFVEQYLKPGKEVPWLSYAKQPDCVFFSHIAHAKAGLDCSTCHGNHGETETLRTYEYNWISTYSRDIWGKNIMGIGSPPARMKMDDCADCHRRNNVRDACFVCHK